MSDANTPPPGSPGTPTPGTPGTLPPPPPPYANAGYYPSYGPPPQPARKERAVLTKLVTGVLTSLVLLSLLANVYLGIFFVKAVKGPAESVYAEGDVNRRIVILPIAGMIDDSTSLFVKRAFKALDANPPKALILRIESPGGGVSASDRIWYDIKQFKAKHKIPVVASYGSLAASGGYYISAQADTIIAEPTTITGSIGVIAQAFTVQELLGKIGVTPEVIPSTKSTAKDGMNPMRAWTDRDRKELLNILDKAYERFVNIVAEGRKGKLTREEVEKVATGAPYTTDEALANKLIDEEGFVDTAITRAKELAKLTTGDAPQVTVVVDRQGGLLSLLSGSAPNIQPGVFTNGLDSQQVRRWFGELTTPRLEYLMQH
jgi:protease IV